MLTLSRLLLTAGLLATVVALHAQYVQLTTNPSSLIFGVFKIESEFGLPNNFAIEPEAAVLVKGQRFWTPDYDTEGYRFGVVGKKYFDPAKPHEGWYGMVYARTAEFTFTDFVEEGDRPDQRDFERSRSTIGFGVGVTDVGRDGFVFGASLGIGRHFVDDKDYTSPAPVPGSEISDSDDADIFDVPIDVYGRIYAGLRLFLGQGRAEKDAYEAKKAEREAAQRDRVQQRLDDLHLAREQELQKQRDRRRELQQR